jgi:hypothetical protein
MRLRLGNGSSVSIAPSSNHCMPLDFASSLHCRSQESSRPLDSNTFPACHICHEAQIALNRISIRIPSPHLPRIRATSNYVPCAHDEVLQSRCLMCVFPSASSEFQMVQRQCSSVCQSSILRSEILEVCASWKYVLRPFCS